MENKKGFRGRLKTAATSKMELVGIIAKMELFVITVNGWKPLTYITKSSILDVVAVLGPPLGFTNILISFVRS